MNPPLRDEALTQDEGAAPLPATPTYDELLERVAQFEVQLQAYAEKSIRQGEEKYRSLFENSLDAIFLTSPDGTTRDANPAACKLFGMTKEELCNVGRAGIMVQTRALAEAIEERARAGCVRRELTFVRRDGTCFAGESTSVIVDTESAEQRSFVIVRDLTERKQAEEAIEQSSQKLAEILESIQDDFYVLDRDWRFAFASLRFTSRIGKLPQDFLGNNIWEMFPGHIGTDYEENLRAAMETRETRRFEMRGKYTDAWYRMTVSPSAEGVTVLGSEITVNRRMEDALREMNARLVETDQRKNEFLGILSHELRNPLTPIRNSLYILDRATPGEEQARRAYSVLDRQVTHLAHIVDDLLDVTRVTRGKIRLQRVRLDLVDLVRKAIEDHQTILNDHKVTVELPNDATWVNVDPTRIGQVLGNLLGNAAKFTPKGGKVSMSLTRGHGHAKLEVTDNGIGIDPETRRRLFEPFAQGDRSLDRSRGGLGLGLALVKGLIDLHGGEVSVHSDGPGCKLYD